MHGDKLKVMVLKRDTDADILALMDELADMLGEKPTPVLRRLLRWFLPKLIVRYGKMSKEEQAQGFPEMRFK